VSAVVSVRVGDQRPEQLLPQKASSGGNTSNTEIAATTNPQPPTRPGCGCSASRRKQGEQCSTTVALLGDEAGAAVRTFAAQGVAMLGLRRILVVAGIRQHGIVGARPNTSTLVIPDVAPSKARPVSEALRCHRRGHPISESDHQQRSNHNTGER